MDPHLLIMRKSPTEKGREEVCVCLYMCPCVYVVHMKWRIPWSQGRVRGKGPLPVYISVFIRPGVAPLVRMKLIWPYSIVSMAGLRQFFPQSCWFPESNPSARFCSAWWRFSTESGSIAVSPFPPPVVFTGDSKHLDMLAYFRCTCQSDQQA